MDYGFVHEGKVFTPNGTAVPLEDNKARNAAIAAAELKHWQGKPDRMLAYFAFPADELPLFGKSRNYRANYEPLLHTYVNKSTEQDPGVDHVAYVSTWNGTKIGTITYARVFRHNFGGRVVSLRVRGSNGALYYGRASWDNGTCVMLKRAKS